MRTSVVLLACLTCVASFPFFPFGGGRGLSWLRGLIECPPYGSYGYSTSYRCRQQTQKDDKGNEMTVLDLRDGNHRVKVVDHAEAGPFAIVVPEKVDLDAPRCGANEVYVSELDICIETKPSPVADELKQEKKKMEKRTEEEKPHVTILEVGSYEKEKCAPDQMWVPEVGICMDINPPPPMESEEWRDKPLRRKLV